MLNNIMITFFSCNSCMMPFCLLVFLSNKLSLSEIRTLIMGDKIDSDFFVVGGGFLFILFNATLYHNVHKVFDFPFLVDLVTLLNDQKLAVIIDSYPLFYVGVVVPLLRMRKNLLKESIVSILYTFLLPEVGLSYLSRFRRFYRDWMLRSFNITLTLTVRTGVSSLSFYISLVILLDIAENRQFWNSSNIF